MNNYTTKVILYLDNSVSPNSIPSEVLTYVDKGLEIIFVSDDIKSHNKYYYTLKKYPDSMMAARESMPYPRSV